MDEKPDSRQKVTILSKKDLQISYFVGPGAGGQKKNKTHSGCQIIHEESGAIGRASDSRSLEQNKKSAFQKLCNHPKMKFWIAKKVYEIRQNETLEQTVEKSMSVDNLKFEIKDELGRWIEVKDDYFETELAKKENEK